MTIEYNAPPGWPVPKGWTPAPNWRKPKSWPDAPAGWIFFHEPAANQRHKAAPKTAEPVRRSLWGWGRMRRVAIWSAAIFTTTVVVSSGYILVAQASPGGAQVQECYTSVQRAVTEQGARDDVGLGHVTVLEVSKRNAASNVVETSGAAAAGGVWQYTCVFAQPKTGEGSLVFKHANITKVADSQPGVGAKKMREWATVGVKQN